MKNPLSHAQQLFNLEKGIGVPPEESQTLKIRAEAGPPHSEIVHEGQVLSSEQIADVLRRSSEKRLADG